jgi:hypothetical protein
MTNLEDFLNEAKLEGRSTGQVEPANGSFSCQHEDCDEVIYEGAIDRNNRRLTWTCTRGHHSSVVI